MDDKLMKDPGVIKTIKQAMPDEIEELEANVIEAEHRMNSCTDRLIELNDSLKSYMKSKDVFDTVSSTVKKNMKKVYTDL